MPIKMHIEQNYNRIIMDDPYCLKELNYTIRQKKPPFIAEVIGMKLRWSIPSGAPKQTKDEAVASLLAWLSNVLEPTDTINDWN